ncbi:riboflavin synthase [Ichthyobacterium seriolicida]|uniref:Riboflavin synthase n=1 Tax=Ichthyobacterium seriolicida TaxID=242600 RepID=A0A1J1E4V9_9FLAO|nr:riboflavin synthase [Ichthyobacterium seriolicida]BAV95092.1 riboflavin synthase alpha chain [Ichthyobacterium seriolicida]
MFTGIIESIARVEEIKMYSENIRISLSCDFVSELKVDQSISHNGICLTVESINGNIYTTTAIKETVGKTNIGSFVVGDEINVERCLKIGDRLDGHLVQGHIDQTGVCTDILRNEGSDTFYFSYDRELGNITVKKGSITINGVSLTVVDSGEGMFSVAIIPYTYNNTNFRTLKVNDIVNLEFDIVGKYIHKLCGYNK